MSRPMKTILFLVLGLFIVFQSGMTLYTFSKLNKLESTVSLAKPADTTTTNQVPEKPGSQSSPIPVDITNAPFEGDPNAPVTLVEFTDFECSFCKASQPTVHKLMEKYEGKIKHVLRNYPIGSIHGGAVDAAMAGYCANDQNKFWEYHDAMFEKAHDGGSLKKDVFQLLAKDQGLDLQTFNACLDSKKYLDQVQKDFEDGTSYSVSGTPTFFINNRIISGNQPIEMFEKVIDEELAKSK